MSTTTDARGGPAATGPAGGGLSLEGLHPAVSALLGTVSVLVAVLVAVDLQSVVRQLLVVVFLLTVPGATLIRLLRFESLLFQCCVAIAGSVVVDMLLALGMVELGLWRPASAVVALAVGCAVLSVVPHLLPTDAAVSDGAGARDDRADDA